MESEKDLTGREAFGIIESMIITARQEISAGGFYYLLWGWLVLAGALADYIMLVFMKSPYHALSWAVLMPLGALITIFAAISDNRKPAKVKSFLEGMLTQVLTAFVVSLVLVCFVMPFTGNWVAFFPVLMVLYAIWLFVSGKVLRFRPLVIGGIVNWVLALAGFLVGYDVQLLLLALAVLLGYIIPGQLLQHRYRKVKHV